MRLHGYALIFLLWLVSYGAKRHVSNFGDRWLGVPGCDMGFQFAFSQVQPLKGTWNPFFMILSLFMAVNGAFTAIQFIETLVQKKETSASHTSKKVSALFSIFACAWCIGVNCVWVMHFLAMSAGRQLLLSFLAV